MGVPVVYAGLGLILVDNKLCLNLACPSTHTRIKHYIDIGNGTGPKVQLAKN